MKKTGIYKGNQKPVRVGVYEREYPGGDWEFCWWDNGWGHPSPLVDWAKSLRRMPSEYQQLPWRGVQRSHAARFPA